MERIKHKKTYFFFYHLLILFIHGKHSHVFLIFF